ETGAPLQAFMAVLAEQLLLIEDNLQQLYADEFIETCASWVIPYIGDLVGSNGIYQIDSAAYGSRAEVANTIGYRRRKGTLLALDQIAMDVSGMPARGVEEFKRLITTESMRLVRPLHDTTVDLRHVEQLYRFGTAFDKLNRTIDVRRIAPRNYAPVYPDPTALDIVLHGGGKSNIPDLTMYLWRWQPYMLQNAPGCRIDSRRCMCSPLGQNIPLFNNRADRVSFERLTTRYDVPQPIGRREFAHHKKRFYSSDDNITFIVDGITLSTRTSIQVLLDGVAVDVSQICCQNLSDRNASSWGETPPFKVGIDPELGRIQLGSGIPVPNEIRISYCYGFPAGIGGGPYDRSANLSQLVSLQPGFYAAVNSDAALAAAVATWNTQPAGTNGVIVIENVNAFNCDLTGANAILLPPTSQLWILSAQVSSANASVPIYNSSLAVLRGNIEITGVLLPGENLASPPLPGNCYINGVWLSGQLSVTGEAANVFLCDSTVVPGIALNPNGQATLPGEPSLIITSPAATVALQRVITGPVVSTLGATVRICNGIVDAGSPCGVAYAATDMASAGADLHIEESTVVGKVHVHTLTLASNTIFYARLTRLDSWPAALWCARRQSGCVRFCWLPTPAITPQTYKCLPDTASDSAALVPQFITLEYGRPSYAMLSGYVPVCIMNGADDGSEMGAYHITQEWQAIRNVQIRLGEYLPFSLEAGIFLVPSATEPVVRAVAYGYGAPNTGPICDDGEGIQMAGIGVGLL
ncbi:MAG: hypothetical protein WA419_12935, partial [Silvibacterium sp.]